MAKRRVTDSRLKLYMSALMKKKGDRNTVLIAGLSVNVMLSRRHWRLLRVRFVVERLI